VNKGDSGHKNNTQTHDPIKRGREGEKERDLAQMSVVLGLLACTVHGVHIIKLKRLQAGRRIATALLGKKCAKYRMAKV